MQPWTLRYNPVMRYNPHFPKIQSCLIYNEDNKDTTLNIKDTTLDNKDSVRVHLSSVRVHLSSRTDVSLCALGVLVLDTLPPSSHPTLQGIKLSPTPE